ncbi:ABC transporter substrate-binding protein [Amycolatopsis pithecellobii]|uniref:ABC transporter substrate-binding protein n=1 Tax=Amycolatopsis pithecellobii TaxID=664692 RepID=UPI00140BB5F9
MAKTPTGTVPFKFVSYTTARNVILEANPGYRGTGPYLQRLEFPIIIDADARVAALRSGSI